jgi:asparagine synthetase B (glutamine-hydrolysing)
MKTIISVLHKYGENAIPILLEALENAYPEVAKSFGVATSSKLFTGTNVRGLETQGTDSVLAVGYVYSGSAPQHDLPHLITGKNATVTFDGRIYSTQPKGLALNVVGTALLYPDNVESIISFLKNVEGDFSLFVTQASNILAARDPVGVQPLYYGENKELIALSSNRKALWKLGIEEPKSFPPGHLGVASREGFFFKPVKVLSFCEPQSISLESAARTLKQLLEHSIQ